MHSVRLIVAGLFITLIGSTAWAAPCDGFTDVDDGNTTYCSAVTYLKSKGITLGCTGTAYCPNDYVTRLQMALLLQRMGRGGGSNVLGDWTDTIGGGVQNTTVGVAGYQVIGGGGGNVATAFASTIAGGEDNQATGQHSSIAGGEANHATGIYSFIAGGDANIASGGSSSTVGYANTASGVYSTTIGSQNSAAGESSIVVGYKGTTTSAAAGSVVFSDFTEAPGLALFGTSSANVFVVGATGGIQLLTSKDHTTGCSIAAGGGTWTCTSSKDVKRDFEDVDRQQVLDRVLALPVQRWRYMNEPQEIRHMGTFAQDFRAAFGLGADDNSISMADADGVALAAIQGLNARLAATVAQQSRQLAEMAEQLSAVARDLQALRAGVPVLIAN